MIAAAASSSSSRRAHAALGRIARQAIVSVPQQRVLSLPPSQQSRSFSTTRASHKGFGDMGRQVLSGLNRVFRGSVAERARQAGGLTPSEARQQAESQRQGMEASLMIDSSGQVADDSEAYTPRKLSDFERARLLDRAAKAKAKRRWGGDGAREPEFHATTGNFKISPRKLKALADQIGGKPIDYAIVQMQFSPKQAAVAVHKMLVRARNDAVAEGLDRSRMIVHEAWVGKGQSQKRIDIKGRGRHGIITYFQAHMDVVLRHGKTQEELLQKRIKQARRRVQSVGTGGVARTHAPLSQASRGAWHY